MFAVSVVFDFEVTVKVIAVLVMDVIAIAVLTATPLMFLEEVPLPVVNNTVGAVPPVLNTKPLGAVKMMVPVPISPKAPSASVGPVNVVQVPLVALSAEIALPPVAAVNVSEAAMA